MTRVSKILLALLLLVAGYVRSEEPAHSGGSESTVGSYSTTFNGVSATVASSAIDLANYAGIYVKSTGTASTNLSYQFSNTTTFPTPDNGVSVSHGAYFIKKRGQYVRFIASGPSGTTYTAKVWLYTALGIKYAAASGKFAWAASTTATAQYVTPTANLYVLFSNPGSLDIIGDWSTTAATPTNLSNTGSVRIPAGGILAQSVPTAGIPLGYSYFVYSNPNTSVSYNQVNW